MKEFLRRDWSDLFKRDRPPRRPLVEEVVNKPSYRIENTIYYHGRSKDSVEDVLDKMMALGFRVNNGAFVNRNDPVEAIKEFTGDLGAIDRVLLALRYAGRGDE